MIPEGLTTPVLVDEVHRGDDLGVHYIKALDKIKAMNTDRSTVRRIILLHNKGKIE